MSGNPDPNQWWRLAEERPFHPLTPIAYPAPVETMFRVHDAELSFEFEKAESLIAEIRPAVAAGAWSHILDLLDLRIKMRRGTRSTLDSAAGRIAQLMVDLSADEQPTRARLHHLKAVLHLRLNDFPAAETELTRALQLIEDSPSKLWILDGFGQLFTALGAWGEARYTFGQVISRKRASGDAVGVAITAGNWSRLELDLGNAPLAFSIAGDALATTGPALASQAKMRLQTTLLDAALEMGDQAAVVAARSKLESMMRDPGLPKHHLSGFACLAMARAAAGDSHADLVETWLNRAGEQFTLPEHVSLLQYWRAKLIPAIADDPTWVASIKVLFNQVNDVTDAEVLTDILLAERSAAMGQAQQMRQYLNSAFSCAAVSNNSLLIAKVDHVFGELDPHGLSARLVERYTGRPAAELQSDSREDATVVFTDLVGFTPRSLELTPVEVMGTVRNLFEWTGPVLTRHNVQPITYMGDGLLAVARGPSHLSRAVAFATDLVRLAQRITLVRKSLGDKWGTQLRAGVASGQVVMGTLGSHLKLEFAAIGLTTNLASRLQGVANPNEVVWAENAPGGPADAPAELVQLKGFSHPVPIRRIAVGL